MFVFKKYFPLLFTAFIAVLLSCNGAADSPKDAASILTGIPSWQIDQISVNDAVTFKDGKMTQQFGGVDFERYMETVELKKNGTFSGRFKGEAEPFLLKWKESSDKIIVSSADTTAKGGDWTIAPADVHKDSFIMKTKSTAYNYPQMTEIALKFKAQK